jgi:transcriptional regulator with XRE-family HTH domain
VWIDQRKYKALGAAFSLARTEAGVTQKQLAAKLRKPQSFVSSYETGQRRLDLLEISRIADALKMPILELIRRCLQSSQSSRRGVGKH